MASEQYRRAGKIYVVSLRLGEEKKASRFEAAWIFQSIKVFSSILSQFNPAI